MRKKKEKSNLEWSQNSIEKFWQAKDVCLMTKRSYHKETGLLDITSLCISAASNWHLLKYDLPTIEQSRTFDHSFGIYDCRKGNIIRKLMIDDFLFLFLLHCSLYDFNNW